jgi:hypothetical protein
LAVDLGIRTGLALFGKDGRLSWYRSQNFGNRSRLKRGVQNILDACPELIAVVCEGGGSLKTIWEREAAKRRILFQSVAAQTWREDLLLPRDRRDAATAKRKALLLARQVIEWSGAPRPTALRHDAAEAILVGFWSVVDLGWLEAPPGWPDRLTQGS